jgi:hypothetical protein
MAYNDFFSRAANDIEPDPAIMQKAQKEAVLFLEAALKAGVIDGYDEIDKEKQERRIHTYKIRAPESEIRYSCRSLLSASWVDAAKTKKGVMEPRKKLYDYYLHLTQSKQTGAVTMEFTVMGLGRHVNDNNRVHSVTIEKMDKRKTNPFFRKTSMLMLALKPFVIDKARRFETRLERLTGPGGVR